jgi:hypothetical protein
MESDTGQTCHYYRVFGLTFCSYIYLPELATSEIDAVAEPDVVIQQGEVPDLVDPVNILGFDFSHGTDHATLDIAKTARFHVRRGNEITVMAYPNADEGMLRVYLLGSAIGVICYQRGIFPLHANAIAIGDRAFAFCGVSGAGKSTLAAHFHQKGHRILCDDVCAISFDDKGMPFAWPGIPRLKLWGNSLEAMGKTREGLTSIGGRFDKFHVPIDTYASGGPFPLVNIYWLDYAAKDQEAGIFPLGGLEAVNALMANTYRRRFVELLGGAPRFLQQVKMLLKNCGVFTVRRRGGFDLFEAEADMMERHMRSVASEVPTDGK